MGTRHDNRICGTKYWQRSFCYARTKPHLWMWALINKCMTKEDGKINCVHTHDQDGNEQPLWLLARCKQIVLTDNRSVQVTPSVRWCVQRIHGQTTGTQNSHSKKNLFFAQNFSTLCRYSSRCTMWTSMQGEEAGVWIDWSEETPDIPSQHPTVRFRWQRCGTFSVWDSLLSIYQTTVHIEVHLAECLGTEWPLGRAH